jgi:hypothetical protein
MPEMQSALCLAEAELEKAWQVISTPQDWARQGDCLFEHEQFAAAAECYRHAGVGEREHSHRRHLRGGRHDEAAPFAASDAGATPRSAGRLRRLGGDLPKATGAVWRRQAALICEAELAESRRDWRGPANLQQRSRTALAARQGRRPQGAATFF